MFVWNPADLETVLSDVGFQEIGQVSIDKAPVLELSDGGTGFDPHPAISRATTAAPATARSSFLMRIGRIALVRCRLDAIQGKRNEEQRLAAERIVVRGEHCAVIGLDLRRQSFDLGAACLLRFSGRQPDGCERDFLAADRLLAWRHADDDS